MTRLLVNIDHVATLRNARRESFPDPAEAARLCEGAGASGIVFHLRQDRRHIVDADVARLKECVQGKLDFELSLAPEIVNICCETVPDLATLVPERREEVTTEGGLDVVANRQRLLDTVPRLLDAGIDEVALFVDPVEEHIYATKEVGATCIELHTGAFANAKTDDARRDVLNQLAAAAEQANRLGLGVHAGHGFDRSNYPVFARAVRHVEEVSIGFALVARALAVGFPAAVREMLEAMKPGYTND